jgi:chaperonin GroEL
MKEKKARIEDAVHATRAAVEEGILPGGGVALLRARRAIDELKDLDHEEALGAKIVRDALESPIRMIARNAGVNASVVIDKIEASKDASFGYNALTLQHGDLIAQGVIDPLKVVRLALENASSIATLLLTTDALVGEAPKPAKAKAGGGGGMEDMGDMGGDFD